MDDDSDEMVNQSMNPQPIEVVIIDDQLAVRRGVELLLRSAGLRVAGLSASAGEAAQLLIRRRFDVALVESVLEGVPSAPLLVELIAERPELPVVVYAGRDDVALAAAAAADLPGLVLKSSPPSTLLEAVRAVAGRSRFVDPEVVRRLPERVARPPRRGIALLSPREREILRLLATGLSGSEIAGELFLSGETVRTHVRNAVQKLGARTRTQAVALLVAHDGGLPIERSLR
jgi:DNA-binding NarL/FixJ family response regulator